MIFFDIILLKSHYTISYIMCRTYGRVLAIGALFALILPGLMAMFLMAPMSEVTTVETIGGNQLSISSHVMTSREVEEINSSIGIRQDGKNYNILIDGHGTGLAPPTSEQLNDMAGSASVTNSVTSTGLAVSATYDISTQPYFPIVGNQGSQGSCAAWALTYYAYGYEVAKDNGWTDASTGNPAHLMSPAWTYNMVDGGVDSGTSMGTNAAIITSWGVASMATDPYVASDPSSWGSQTAFLDAPLQKALSYSYMTFNGATTISSIEALLATNVPVTFAIDAGQFNNMGSNDVLTSSEYSSSTVDHAQCIVGYNSTMTVAGSTDVGAFKVVNSWGSSFGNKGYYWITYAAFEKIGANLQLTYITDKPASQPTLLATWQFSTAPTRDSALTVGIGAVGSSTKVSPFFVVNGATATAKFPTFMALDISSLQSTYASGTTSFYLTIGTAKTSGVVSSFKTAQYLNGYGNAATTTSGQSPNVPLATPCSVTVSMTASSSTSTVPGTPTGVTATAGSSSITVGWTAPTSNGGSAITGYNIYRGTASGQETLLGSVASTVRSYTDTTAVSGTTYYYQVAVVNAIGASSKSTEVKASITITVPSVPGGVSATASASSVTLSWTYSGSSVTGFQVLRGTTSGGEILLATVGSSVLTYTDSAATVGVRYYYQVKACNAQSDSSASAEVSAMITATPVAPDAPTGLTTTSNGSYALLRWTAPTSNGGSAITSYNIYRGTSAGSESTMAIGSSTTQTYTDSTVVAGKTYYYVVKAVSAVGTSSASNEASYTESSVPSAPTNLTASLTTGKITLTWTAPASGGSAITGYTVLRGTSSSLTDQASIASVTMTSFTDLTASAGTTYYYTVKAVNAVGSSAASAPVSIMVGRTVPGTPIGLTAVGSDGVVTLTWIAPANGGSVITGYNIYRSTVPGSEKLLVTLGTGTSFTDNGLTNGRTYYYRVSAVNSVGEGALGSEVSAVPAQTAVVPGNFTLTATVADGEVCLTWTVPSTSSPLLSFEVMREASGTESAIAKLTASRTGYVDLTAVSGTDYTYWIVAYSSTGSISTPSITVHTLGAVVNGNAYNIGSTANDQSAIWIGVLIVTIVGTICSVAYIRSRRNRP